MRQCITFWWDFCSFICHHHSTVDGFLVIHFFSTIGGCWESQIANKREWKRLCHRRIWIIGEREMERGVVYFMVRWFRNQFSQICSSFLSFCDSKVSFTYRQSEKNRTNTRVLNFQSRCCASVMSLGLAVRSDFQTISSCSFWYKFYIETELYSKTYDMTSNPPQSQSTIIVRFPCVAFWIPFTEQWTLKSQINVKGNEIKFSTNGSNSRHWLRHPTPWSQPHPRTPWQNINNNTERL